MCQQWFSVAGLIFDICGFLIIAREWWDTYQHSVLKSNNEVERDFILTNEGEEIEKIHREADASMWRNTVRENKINNRYRRRTFLFGTFLIIIGFTGQIIGSMPYAQFLLGLSSCS